MSTTIDEKVVEMRFDNRDFESGVSESMSTIERLKAALKFGDSADGLENIGRAARNVNLSGMTESARECSLQFSALQVAAVTAIQDITRAAERYGKKIVMSLGPDQVSAGWSKYAEKTAAVQTIMSATSSQFEDTGVQMAYVNEQLEKLNWFTDETSFNFLDMVNNIGKFTSNNIALDTSVTAMEGISNWAAISGATIGEAGRAMYNLSQAISMGSLKLQDWKSIELANMATAEFKQTAIDTALAMGQLEDAGDGLVTTLDGTEVSIESFRESLKDGWLTSEVLLGTLEQYGAFTDKVNEAMTKLGADMSASEFLGYLEDYERGILDVTEVADEFGISASKLQGYLEELSSEEYDLGKRAFRAAQEAKTFKEAIDATKDAVSTGWMTSFEKIFGGYTEAKKMWSQFAEDLWEIFASGGTRRNNFLSDIFDTSWQKITREVNRAGVNVQQFEGTIKDMARNADPNFDALLQQFGSLEEMFSQGALSTDLITQALQELSETTAGPAASIEGLSDRFEEFRDVVNQVWWGGFGKGEEAIAALTEAGYDYDFVSKLMDKTAAEWNKDVQAGWLTIDQFAAAVSELTDEQKKQIGMTDEDIIAMKELAEQAANSEGAIGGLIDELNGGQVSGRQYLRDIIHNLLQTIINFKDTFSDAWDIVFGADTAAGVKGFLGLMAEMTGNVADLVGTNEIFKMGLAAIVTVFKLFGKVIGGISSGALWLLTDVFGFTAEAAGNLTTKISGLMGNIDAFTDGVKSISDKLKMIFKAWMDLSGANSILSGVGGMFLAFTTDLRAYFEGVSAGISEFITHVSHMQRITKHNLPALGRYFKEHVINPILKINDKNVFKTFRDAFKDMADTIRPKFKPLEDGFNRVKAAIQGFSTKALDAFKGAVAKIKTIVDEHGGWGAIIKSVISLVTMFEMLRLLHGVASVPKRIAEAFEAIGDAINGLRTTFIGASIAGIGLGVLAVAGAIAILARIDWKEAWPAAVAVVAILALLTTAQGLLGRFGGDGGAGKMTAFGFAVGSFAFALSAIVGMLMLLKNVNLSDYTDGISIMLGAMLFLSLAMHYLSTIASGKKLIAASAGILSMVLSLGLLLGVLVGFIGVGMLIVKLGPLAAAGLVAIVGALALLTASISVMGKFATSSELGKAAILLVALVMGLNAMANVIKKFSDLTWGQFRVGVAYMAIAAAGIALFIWGTNKLLKEAKTEKLYSIAASILSIALAVAALVVAMALFQSASIGIGAFFGVLIILAVLVALVSSLDGAKFEASTKGIFAIAGAMLILVGAIALLGVLPWDVALQGSIGIGAMLIALGYSLKLAGTAVNKATMVNILAMTAAVMALSALAFILGSNGGWETAGPAAVAIGVMLLALGKALQWANVGASSDTAVSILALVPMLIALAAAFKIMEDIPWQSLMASGIAMVAVLALMFTAMSIFSKNTSASAGDIGAILAMSVALVALGVAFKMIAGATTDIPTLITIFGGLAVVMIALAAAIWIVSKAGIGVLAFAAAISAIGVAAIMAGIAALAFAGAIYIVGKALPLVGTGLTAVGNGINNMIVAVASAEGSIGAFLNVMNGIGTAIYGVLSYVAAGLREVADGATLAAFGAVFLALGLVVLSAGLVVGAVALVVLAAGLGLVGVAALYAAQGFVSLATSIAMGIVIIGAAWQVLKTGSVEAGVNLIKGFSDGVSSGIGTALGAVSSLGSSIISTLFSALGEHSPSVYAEEAGEYLDEGLANGIENGKNDVLSKVKEVGTNTISKLVDVDALEAMAKELGVDFGTLLGDGLTGGFDLSSFLKDGVTTDMLSSLIPSGFDFGQLSEGNFDYSKIMEQMQSSMGGGLSLGGVDGSAMTEGISEVLTSVTDKAGEFQNAGETLVTSFNTGMNSAAISTEVIEGSVDNLLVSLGTSAGQFRQAGTAMLSNVGAGMKTADAKDYENVIAEFVNSIATSVRDKVGLFKEAGGYFDEGLANGIAAKGFQPVLAAAKLGQDVARALRDALGVHSPSTVSYGIGDWTVVGLVNALKDGTSDVYDSGYSVGESAASGLSGAMSIIDDILNSDMDFEPTITPVLDLSNVQQGFRSIDSMSAAVNAYGIPSTSKRDEVITVNHTFDDITIKGVNNKEDFVAMANYTIDKITNTMRRQSRR